MKKYLIILSAFAALVACSKVEKEEQPTVDQLTFNFTVNSQDDTKAKAGWEDGDVVFVFFKNIATKYIKLTRSGAAWTATEFGGVFDTEDFSGISEGDKVLTAVHFPQFVGAVTVSYNDETNRFSFTVGDEYIYTYYMYATPAYTVTGSTVSATIAMAKPAGYVQFFVPMPAAELDEGHTYQLLESHISPRALTGVTLAGVLNQSTQSAGYALRGYAASNNGNNGMMFSGVLGSAGVSTAYTFSLVTNLSAAKPYALGTQTLSGTKTISEGVIFNLLSSDNTGTGKWSARLPYVDLGLASGTKWATGSLTDNGTSGSILPPATYGKYYSWGETVGREETTPGHFGVVFTHENNVDWNAGTSSYNHFTTEGDVLGLADAVQYDAATKNLGADWHMPDASAVEELMKRSYANATVDGVGIRSITGKNGLVLAIVRCGYGGYPGPGYTDRLYNKGEDLRIWSRTSAGDKKARRSTGSDAVYGGERYYRFNILAVYDPS